MNKIYFQADQLVNKETYSGFLETYIQLSVIFRVTWKLLPLSFQNVFCQDFFDFNVSSRRKVGTKKPFPSDLNLSFTRDELDMFLGFLRVCRLFIFMMDLIRGYLYLLRVKSVQKLYNNSITSPEEKLQKSKEVESDEKPEYDMVGQ